MSCSADAELAIAPAFQGLDRGLILSSPAASPVSFQVRTALCESAAGILAPGAGSDEFGLTGISENGGLRLSRASGPWLKECFQRFSDGSDGLQPKLTNKLTNKTQEGDPLPCVLELLFADSPRPGNF
jgi:hypothetical protein